MENTNISSEPNIGMFDHESIARVKIVKDVIQKAIIWTLVGGVALGAILILFTGSEASEILSKFLGTLLLLAAAALISFIEFSILEKGNASAQKLAIFGVILNIIWTILWILATWGAFDIWARGACQTHYGYSYCPTIGFSILGMLTMASTSLSGLGLFGSVILDIYEGKKKSTIHPLKVTSFICLVYAEIHSTIRIFTSSSSHYSYSSTPGIMARFDILASFVASAWFITFLVALILSKREKNADEYARYKEKDEEQRKIIEQAATNVSAPAAPKTDEELRAEIEEKVRRELIEKEVRARLEKEMSEKN